MANKLRFFDMNVENGNTESANDRREEKEEITVVYPRLFRLRELQAAEGLKLRNLRKEQRGIAAVPFFHHISKVTEGKIDSYRVRICRSCSGLSVLLELGSYADEESAMLLNDAHEIMQGRTKQLHILVPEDIKYLSTLAIRRRGTIQDLPLLNVLQERLWKCQSKRPAEEIPTQLPSFVIPRVEEESKRQRSELTAIATMPVEGPLDHPIRNAFRTNVELVQAAIPHWSICALEENVLVAMIREFVQSLESTLVPPGENILIPELSADTSATHAFQHLVRLAQVPRGLLFTIITSVTPSSVADIYYLHRRLSYLLPQDVLTAKTYRLNYKSAYDAVVAHNEDDPCVMELFRLTNNACSYLDYSIRLSIWDVEIVDKQEAEYKLMGLHYQAQNYLLGMLDICSHCTSAACLARCVDITRKLLSLYISSAIIIHILCFDVNTLSRIERLFNSSSVTSCFTSGPLELLCVNLVFAVCTASNLPKPSSQQISQIHDVLKLIPPCENQSSGQSLVTCERLATAYLSLLLFTYHHCTKDIVEQTGLSIVHLLNEALRTVDSLAELLDEHECTVFTLELIIAAYMLLDIHSSFVESHAIHRTLLNHIIDRCRYILETSATRYVLSKMLLEATKLEQQKNADSMLGVSNK